MILNKCRERAPLFQQTWSLRFQQFLQWQMVEQWKCWWFPASKPCSNAQTQAEWWRTTVNTVCSKMMTTSSTKMSRPATDFQGVDDYFLSGACLSFTVSVCCLPNHNRPDRTEVKPLIALVAKNFWQLSEIWPRIPKILCSRSCCDGVLASLLDYVENICQ